MDISFKTPEGRFNYRACGIFLHDGKLLAMQDDPRYAYYLPGGRVQMNEAADAALLRELKEELGIAPAIVRPLWIVQSFFNDDVTGERFHELGMYYLMDIAGTDLLSRGDVFTARDAASGRISRYEWMPIERVKREYIYPLFIRRLIDRLPDSPTFLTEYE